MVFGPASQLGVARFEDIPPNESWPGRSDDDAEITVNAVYRQVLGNAYVMESERLAVAESQFKLGELSVREFVRYVAKSELYQSRFFDSCPRYRAIELNFKHLLGRAPDGFSEMKAHSAILDTEGFGAEIDSYIDSDEYMTFFGEDTVPFHTGYKTQPGRSMVEFTHMFKLLRGSSSSDFKGSLSGKKPVLNKLVINENPAPIVAPSGGTEGNGWSFQTPGVDPSPLKGSLSGADGRVFRVEITGYRANVVNRVSKFRRTNRVELVPFDKLSETYKRVHRQGCMIASISLV
ncbi:MAG: phycobilisome linker polypeptide [Cyanobacteria bacterium P01_G01_bin.54]